MMKQANALFFGLMFYFGLGIGGIIAGMSTGSWFLGVPLALVMAWAGFMILAKAIIYALEN